MCPAHTLSGPSYPNPTAEEDKNSGKPNAKGYCGYLLFLTRPPRTNWPVCMEGGGLGGEFGALCTRETIKQ